MFTDEQKQEILDEALEAGQDFGKFIWVKAGGHILARAFFMI